MGQFFFFRRPGYFFLTLIEDQMQRVVDHLDAYSDFQRRCGILVLHRCCVVVLFFFGFVLLSFSSYPG